MSANTTSDFHDDDQTTTATAADGGLTENVATVEDSDAGASLFSQMMAAGFEQDGAETIAETAVSSANVIRAFRAGIDMGSLTPRVALLSTLIDNSGSMGNTVRLPDGTRVSRIDMAATSHNGVLEHVGRQTAGDPVTVLASAALLNSSSTGLGRGYGESVEDDGNNVLYPYQPIAQAPRQASIELKGLTPLYRRFTEVITATMAVMTELEEAYAKTVYGMIGVITDGENTEDGRLHNFRSFRSAVLGVRRTGVVAAFVMYTGKIFQPGEEGYENAREQGLYNLQSLGVDTTEFEGDDVKEKVTHEYLVRRYFTEHGFAPELVLVPGEDPSEIVKAVIKVSKMMTSVSRGQMPVTSPI
jgi:hypothetical protein